MSSARECRTYPNSRCSVRYRSSAINKTDVPYHGEHQHQLGSINFGQNRLACMLRSRATYRSYSMHHRGSQRCRRPSGRAQSLHTRKTPNSVPDAKNGQQCRAPVEHVPTTPSLVPINSPHKQRASLCRHGGQGTSTTLA